MAPVHFTSRKRETRPTGYARGVAEADGGHGKALAAIVRGMVVALVGSVLGGGLGFLFLVVMAHQMPQHRFGLLVLAVNILTLGSVLGVAGADYATIRYVAAASEPGRKRGAMWTPLLLVLAFNVLIALVLVVVAHPVAVHVLDQPEMTNPLRMVAVVLPLTVAAMMLSAALSGMETARGELVRKVAEQGGRIVFSPILYAVGLGVVGAIGGMALAAVLAVVAVGALLQRRLPRGGTTQWLEPKKVISFAWPQTLANVAGQLWLNAAVIALVHFEGARAVALWGAAIAIARLPALVYNAFTFRFSPTISRLWEEQDLDELSALLKSVTRWVAIMAVPLYAIAIVLAHPLLHVYGARYAGGATVLVLIAVAVLVDSLAGPNDRALIMTGRVKLEMAANVSTAVVMTAVSIALTWAWGLDGAAAGLIAYNVMVNALKALLVRRTLNMNSFSGGMLRPIAAAAIAGAITLGIEQLTSLGSSLAGAAVLAIVLLLLYVLVLLRVLGVSEVDRSALRLALRPAA
jgi:O-antigen/teichoic acid export membrane protein